MNKKFPNSPSFVFQVGGLQKGKATRAYRTRFTLSEAEVLRGKRVKSAFFEIYGQLPIEKKKFESIVFAMIAKS